MKQGCCTHSSSGYALLSQPDVGIYCRPYIQWPFDPLGHWRSPRRTKLGLVTAWADSLAAAAAHRKCTEGASKSVSHTPPRNLQGTELGETFGKIHDGPSRAVTVVSFFSHVLVSWRDRETSGLFGPISTKIKRTRTALERNEVYISTVENPFFCWPEAGEVQILVASKDVKCKKGSNLIQISNEKQST